MFFKNKEDIMAATYHEVLEALDLFGNEFDNFLPADEWVEDVDIDYTDDTMEISTTVSSGCGCCSNDAGYHTVPLSYMWETDWQKPYRAQLEQDKKEEAEHAELRRKEQAIKDKERRHQRYLELKKEFEPEPLS